MGRCMAECARLAGGRLLDMGCGDLPYRDLFAPYVDRYVAMDLGRSRYSGGGVSAWGDALCLPFASESFETVLCNQVLEHVAEPQKLLEEAARVLKPGGSLVLTAPHIWGVHEPPEDYYRFTPYGLSYLARRAGLQVLDVQALAGFWVTAGTRSCYYLSRFERFPAGWLVRPAYAVVQLIALALDRIHRVESEAWNHLIVARRPQVGR